MEVRVSPSQRSPEVRCAGSVEDQFQINTSRNCRKDNLWVQTWQEALEKIYMSKAREILCNHKFWKVKGKSKRSRAERCVRSREEKQMALFWPHSHECTGSADRNLHTVSGLKILPWCNIPHEKVSKGCSDRDVENWLSLSTWGCSEQMPTRKRVWTRASLWSLISDLASMGRAGTPAA